MGISDLERTRLESETEGSDQEDVSDISTW